LDGIRFVLGQKFTDNDGTVRYHGAKSSCLPTNPKSKIRAEIDVLKTAELLQMSSYGDKIWWECQ